MSKERHVLECGDLSPLSPAGDLSSAKECSSVPTGIESLDLVKKPWPHAPVHRLTEHGFYMVAAGTLHKQHLFSDAKRLALLKWKLLDLAHRYHWEIEAWAVFANHYHFIARGDPQSANLRKYLTPLHADTARELIFKTDDRLTADGAPALWRAVTGHRFVSPRLVADLGATSRAAGKRQQVGVLQSFVVAARNEGVRIGHASNPARQVAATESGDKSPHSKA